MQKTTNDSELLQASIGGHREAFGSIVERYQSLICGITYSAIGDVSKSEELAQETFIRAWKGLGGLNEPSKFRGWLCTIARNVAKTAIKLRSRDLTDSAGAIKDAVGIESSEPGPVEQVISKEQQAMVWGALERIPENYREPIVLFYREKQSIGEVAGGLGLSEDVVKQRLSRGRKMLKAEIATVVEDVLGRTRPSKVFTVAVLAALPALTAQTATAAVAGAAVKGVPVAKSAFLSGISGSVVGPIVGLLGGIFGMWMSIKNTKSARERRFMIIMSIACLIGVILLIAVPLVLSLAGVIGRWAFLPFFVLFFALLVPFLVWGNARQLQIQIEEGTYVKKEFRPMKLTKGNVYGALGGSIFGSLCWIFVLSFLTKDWFMALFILIFAIILFAFSTKMCLNASDKYWRIVITDMISIALVTFVVVNLRWERWRAFYRDDSFGFEIPLWIINLILFAVFSGLLCMFISRGRTERRLREIKS